MNLYWWLRNRIYNLFHPIKYYKRKKEARAIYLAELELKEGFKDVMIDYNKIDPNIVKWQVILECEEGSGMGREITIHGHKGVSSEDWNVNWKSIAEISKEENV